MITDHKAQPAAASGQARWLRQLAWLLLVLLPVSALGTRWALWHYALGLLLFSLSIGGCLLIQFITAIWLLRRPSGNTQRELRRASLITLGPLFIAAALLRSTVNGVMIHDISTDIQRPPSFSAALALRGEHSNPLLRSAEIDRLQQQAYPDLQSLQWSLSADQSFVLALQAAEQLGWQVHQQDPVQGHIEAVDRTRWFGFRDDIVIRIQRLDAGSQLDLRSVSRVGQGDFGANAARIRQFLLEIEGLAKQP